jgi:hypothetical protein
MINLSVLKDKENLKYLFKKGEPFPYVVIDNFFEQQFYNKLLQDFEIYYAENKKNGKTYNTDVENDKWTSQGNPLSEELRDIGEYLQSEDIKSFLKDITGFKVLRTSEFNSDNTGFYHLMKNNAYLGPHIDHMMDMGANNVGYHVLNIIIYITSEWNPNWGGGTFFINNSDKTFTDVEYKPNRAVVFMHSPISIHGTSKVTNETNNKRISIYFDYYSNEENPYEHLGYKFKLHKSPHLFYLPKITDYLKLKNRKYLFHFASHFKNKFLAYFK